MLNYQEFVPALHLQPYIRKFWVLDNLSSSLATDVKYALPNTCFTLVFIRGTGVVLSYPNSEYKMGEGVYVAGQITGRIGITILPHTKAVMVQLNPWSAPFITRCPFYQLTNQITPMADVNKDLNRSFRGVYFADSKQLSHILNSVLTPVFFQSKEAKFISSCFDLLTKQTTDERFTVAGFADEVGYSVRGLEKQFKQHVGLSPKKVHAILNVRSVVDNLSFSDSEDSLTALAYKYGYADQAHFINAFKSVMEISPGKFNRQQFILPLQY